MLSGLAGSLMGGMASGVGMSVANRAVDAIFGPRQTEVVHKHEGAPAAAPSDPCTGQQDSLNQCLSSKESFECQSLVDQLKQCKAQAV
ncbi:conserved hypothetical protein [Perkinsus marinus ATCC 50983]|nr:conserved hypothetical protein [Perkinsus marinus ATCC 50983]EER14935.1 conserved hypothetical protein [Perkinsus marinus ATCC 50983]|eukprot:XP_002783139.1 conserved hypothetical protein [Perkinsus marinus ATCC 50983]